ncbi:MAG: ATP-binding protein [Candidatus Thorarchaeota archaeon]
MTEVDYYDLVRKKLVLGPLSSPKHRKIIKLMKVFWNEEEIILLSHFDSADKHMSLKQLEERSGMPKDDIKQLLRRPLRNGTISKKGTKYCLEPIIPGIFEKYFQRSRDTEENLKKAAQLYRDIMKQVLPQQASNTDFKLFRPLLPVETDEKLIEINKDYDIESQALPYETVMNLINKYDKFAVITCQCRLIGELSGEPCEVAPAEMGCFVAGPAGEMMVNAGIRGARLLNKEEAIEFLKETEKHGLVHNAINDKGNESSIFFCNCCSCHCGALYPAKLFHELGSFQSKSNYTPKFDNELCTKCEACMRKCPREAIYHQFQNEYTSTKETMVLKEEECIGCGICAANCPDDAIKMVKVRDNIPPDKNMIGTKTFTEMLQ